MGYDGLFPLKQSKLRVVVTGQKVNPPLFESMGIIGKEKCLERLGEPLNCLRKTSEQTHFDCEKSNLYEEDGFLCIIRSSRVQTRMGRKVPMATTIQRMRVSFPGTCAQLRTTYQSRTKALRPISAAIHLWAI